MLQNLSEDVCECLRHAEDCARQAKDMRDPQLRQDFLDLERRWLKLARSYDFSQRLTRFSQYNQKQIDASATKLGPNKDDT